MRSSIDRCLLTRRNHINIHVHSFNDCCRDKLFKNTSPRSFDTLSVSPHTSCANLIIILAIVTAAATRLAFTRPDHFRRAAPCLLLDSGRRASTPACSTMPVRRAGISFSKLPALSGIALLMKLPSSISRTISVRRRRDRVESSCFSLSIRTRRNGTLVI